MGELTIIGRCTKYQCQMAGTWKDDLGLEIATMMWFVSTLLHSASLENEIPNSLLQPQTSYFVP